MLIFEYNRNQLKAVLLLDFKVLLFFLRTWAKDFITAFQQPHISSTGMGLFLIYQI
jgi:hypothetical protein